MMLAMFGVLVAPVTLILLTIEVRGLHKHKTWAQYIPLFTFIVAVLFSQPMAVSQPDNSSAGFFQIRCIIDFVCEYRYRKIDDLVNRYIIMLNFPTMILLMPVAYTYFKTKLWPRFKNKNRKALNSGS